MKKKITSLMAGAALIGSIGSFGVSADLGEIKDKNKINVSSKSEKTRANLADLLKKSPESSSVLDEKKSNQKKIRKFGLFPYNKKSKHDWNIAEEYQEKENIANEKHENIEEKESISQERNEEKGSETEKNVSDLENYVPNKKNKDGKTSSTNARENKSGKFYKFFSAAAGVAKGLLNVADTIATTFTGGKTTSEKIGGMAGVVGGHYISGAICAAVGASMCGALPLVSSIVTEITWSAVPKKYISIPLCVAILAGTAYFTGIPAVASTLAYSLITKYAFKGGIYVGKKIGGFFGNLFSKSPPKVEEKKDINTPPSSTKKID